MPRLKFGPITVDTSVERIKATDIGAVPSIAIDPSGTTVVIANYDDGDRFYSINTDTLQSTFSGVYQPPSTDYAVATCFNPGNNVHPSPFAPTAFSLTGLQNIDINTRSVLGQYPFPNIMGISCYEDTVWIAGKSGVRRINNTDPENPSALNFYFPTPIGMSAMSAILYYGASPAFLFVGSLNSVNPTVFVFNGTDLTSISNFTIPAFAYEFAFQNTHDNNRILYTACGAYGVLTHSLIDPKNPIVIDNSAINTNTATSGVTIGGRFVITADTAAALTVYYPFAGQLYYAGQFVNLPGLTYSVRICGANAYSVNFYGSFSVTQISSIQPQAGPIQGTGSFVYSISTSGNNVFTRDYNSVQIFDANTQNFRGICNIPFNSGVTDIKIDPTRQIVFTIDSTALYAVDLAQSSANCLLNTNSLAAGRAVAIVSTNVFVVGNGVSAWNYATPSSPTNIFLLAVGAGYDIKIPAPYDKAYITISSPNPPYSSCLQVYNINQLPAVSLLWQNCEMQSVPQSLDVSLDAKLTLVGTRATGVNVIDNNSRKMIGTFNPSDMQNSIAICAHPDNYAFITDQEKSQVRILDFSNCQPGDCLLNFEAGSYQANGYVGKIAFDGINQLFVANGGSGFFKLTRIVPNADPQLTFIKPMSITPNQAVPLTQEYIIAVANSTIPLTPNFSPTSFSDLSFSVSLTRGAHIELSTNPGTAVTSVPAAAIPRDAKFIQAGQTYAVVVADSTATESPLIEMKVDDSVGALPQKGQQLPFIFASGNPTLQISPITINEGDSKAVLINVLDSNGVASTSPTDYVDISNINADECFFSLSNAPNVPITRFYPVVNCNSSRDQPQLLFNKPKGNKLPASFTLTPTIGSLTGDSITIDKNSVDKNGKPLLISTFNIDPAQLTAVATPDILRVIQAGTAVTITTQQFNGINPNIPADNSIVSLTWSNVQGASVTPAVATLTQIANGNVTITPSKLFQNNGLVTGTVCATLGSNPTQVCQTFSGTFINEHQPPKQKLGEFTANAGSPAPVTTDLISISNDGTYPTDTIDIKLEGEACVFGLAGTKLISPYHLTPAQLTAASTVFQCDAGGQINVTTTDHGLSVSDSATMNIASLPAGSDNSNSVSQWGILTGVGAGITISLWLIRNGIDYRSRKNLSAIFQKNSYSSILKITAQTFFRTFENDGVSFWGYHIETTTNDYLDNFVNLIDNLRSYDFSGALNTVELEEQKRSGDLKDTKETRKSKETDRLETILEYNANFFNKLTQGRENKQQLANAIIKAIEQLRAVDEPLTRCEQFRCKTRHVTVEQLKTEKYNRYITDRGTLELLPSIMNAHDAIVYLTFKILNEKITNIKRTISQIPLSSLSESDERNDVAAGDLKADAKAPLLRKRHGVSSNRYLFHPPANDHRLKELEQRIFALENPGSKANAKDDAKDDRSNILPNAMKSVTAGGVGGTVAIEMEQASGSDVDEIRTMRAVSS